MRSEGHLPFLIRKYMERKGLDFSRPPSAAISLLVTQSGMVSFDQSSCDVNNTSLNPDVLNSIRHMYITCISISQI